MDELQKVWKRRQYFAKGSMAFIYGVLVSFAYVVFGDGG